MANPMAQTQAALAVLILLASAATAAAAPVPAPVPATCPTEPVRVVRSAGGVVEYHGTVPGIPDLCRMDRSDGNGDFYLGVWRDDWPGAGLAYPSLRAVLFGGTGSRTSFVTRSVPGLQWTDSFINEGPDTLTIDGRRYATVKIAHEREGIEGNTYHSVITNWRDIATGVTLKVVESQISGQSYGPATTWTAVHVMPLR